MKLKQLYLATAIGAIPLSTVAAGLDRSGQSIAAFLQPDNYAEASLFVLDPTVKGQDKAGLDITDMGDDYYFPTAAIKVQATDQISFGLLYDQPYGADATYKIDDPSPAFQDGQQGTEVKVRTNNLTALIGYQPNKNWNFYAGPVWQTVEADISLRGQAYSILSGYNIQVEQKEAYGWLAGFAYQIPEIALKTSVTYRSEIKHNAKAKETSNLPKYSIINPNFAALGQVHADVEAVTPQSVNVDFQTGVAANTLVFTNMRWVHWDQFVVSPVLLQYAGQNLIEYSKDQWSINTGVAYQFDPQWTGSVSVGWDSGAGNPVTTLGPIEGYWSLGLGGQYSPEKNYFLQAGIKYFAFGDAEGKTGNSPKADFTDNYGFGYSVKMGYRF